MDKTEIENLIQMMKVYKIDHLTIENQDQEIEISLDSNSDNLILENENFKFKSNKSNKDNSINNPEKKENLIIKSEFVGVYIEPEKEIVIDSQIKKGQTLGYIEMGNIKKTIKSKIDGILKEIYVEHNEIVEYGQELFKIKIT